MEQIFKEGDRVYLYTLGWGTITELGSFFIIIKFDITDDNRHIGGGLIDLLSFTEYTLEGFSQERPEILPERGQIVWVRKMFPSEWTIGHFHHKYNDMYYISDENKDSTDWGFEIRTTNPYANE